jgi:hypothetical protein
MKVLIGYESSGVVREAFRALGHDAWSCDLQASDDGSPHHYQCDIWDAVNEPWDLAVFHPPCTYLTISAAWAFTDGPYHQKVKPGTLVGQARRDARDQALDDVRRLMALPYPKAIENPIGAISKAIRKPDQIIQPYQFGDDASKATCLWLDRLPKLEPTCHVPGRVVEWPKGSGKTVERWANQTDGGQNKLTPSATRWKSRSKTYSGIASAFAEQWTNINAPMLAYI